MARLPRLSQTGLAHHVILRGNNGQAIFLDADDRTDFLALLAATAAVEQVQLHAYVLMDNHLHLLLTPLKEGGVSRLMQGIGRAYVRRFNRRHHRSGTLWEGRYRSTVLQSERYLLSCMVHLDLNPVVAGLVSAAQDYPWSSHAHYLGWRYDKWLTPHPEYWALGNTPFEREAAYAALVQQGLDERQQHLLEESALKGWAMGDAAFLASLQQQTGRRTQKGRPGRPPLPSSGSSSDT